MGINIKRIKIWLDRKLQQETYTKTLREIISDIFSLLNVGNGNVH